MDLNISPYQPKRLAKNPGIRTDSHLILQSWVELDVSDIDLVVASEFLFHSLLESSCFYVIVVNLIIDLWNVEYLKDFEIVESSLSQITSLFANIIDFLE